MTQERLIIFTRVPHAGTTKTRLIPALGNNGAATLHLQMTQRTLLVADILASNRDIAIEVWFTGGSSQEMANLFGANRTYVAQPTGNLGMKMDAATRSALTNGGSSVVIIGTDCPALDSLTLYWAFEQLQSSDVVLGPATDGGYYLVGLLKPSPQLFQHVDWGTKQVLEQTRSQASRMGLKTAILHELSDVDVPEDLHVWDRAAKQTPCTLKLSIIIPTLNEESTISQVIKSAQTGFGVEVIVSDGGSTDETCSIAASLGAIVVTAERGRASQMNIGAGNASGDLLLFLHADTLLPPKYDVYVRTLLADPGVAAGAFQLGFDSQRLTMRCIQFVANIRSKFLGMPYGDQAIFLRASQFNDIGGFPTLPLMEDFELMLQLRRIGHIVIAPATVQSSTRRWEQHGMIRTTLKNLCCASAYLLGISPYRIAKWRG